MRKVRDHLRSNVVAYLALFVALGGSSYAVAALSHKEKKQVRNIADLQITARAPGLSVKHADTAGNADLLGGKPASAFGAPTSYRIVQNVKNIASIAGNGGGDNVQASCQPGEHVIGGGASSNDSHVTEYQSWPFGTNEWTAAFVNNTGTTATSVQLIAYAICASP